jgi:hypothetical protein
MMKAALVNRHGEQHTNAKLNDRKVREIRTANANGKHAKNWRGRTKFQRRPSAMW